MRRFVLRLPALARQRPRGDVQHVVEHVHGHVGQMHKALFVEAGGRLEGFFTKRIRSIGPRPQHP
jgi:hypothetical protein